MYWYDSEEAGLMLTIGQWDFCPPPPTWREFFASNGIPHRTELDAHRIWAKNSIEPQDYDETIDGFCWETRFDLETGPSARAYRLLKKLDLGPTLRREPNSRTWFSEGDVPTRTADGSTRETTSPFPCSRRG